ncbi:MAG: putative bifunctional diguanylate cyclase/phosphodiesterase [Microcoleaceae cyanobacterium]
MATVKAIGKLQQLELAVFDQMVKLNADDTPDPRLLVIELTEQDIQNQKRWPLSDQVIAELIEKLNQYQPKVIGLDIYRDVAQQPGSQRLTQALQEDNIIVVTHLGVVPPPAASPPDQVGFNDLISDPDNTIRRSLMYAEVGSEKHYSFALRSSLQYLADQDLQFQVMPQGLQIGDAFFPRLRANSGGYQLPPSEAQGWQTLLHYRSEEIARRLTLTQALNEEIDLSWVEDKVVLIGTTAPSLKDIFPTPFSASKTDNHLMPGVWIHAHIVSQILGTVLDGQRLFWYWETWAEWLWLWVWCFLGGVLVCKLYHPFSLGVGTFVAFGALWIICFSAFTQMGWIPFVTPALGLLMTIGVVLAQKVLYSLFYDPLTGLPNRTRFIQYLRQLQPDRQAPSPLFAVLFLDLDRFRMINQGLGYQVGDRLIIATSNRLKRCLPQNAKLARVGGDEFAILLPNLEESDATELADTIQQQLTQPFQINGQEVYTTVSIGITCNSVEERLRAETCLQDAQTAMYQAKVSGKAQHQVFVRGMATRNQERLKLETDLRQAIKNREFQLYYQPIVSLQTLAIVGFEALVRWKSPEAGIIMPGQFIPIAEESGLIIPLGEWVFQEACRQIKLWNQQFQQIPPLMMSINLSSYQFDQVNLVENFFDILMETEVDCRCVKLEITESTIMSDVELAIAILNRFKVIGVQLSLDDFGMGYSSLSYLHRFPVDTLKVDRSFVSRMGELQVNKEIVKAIIILAKNLGLSIIAEGIETVEQMRTLQELKCEYGQGYLFAKPLPASAATELLKRRVIDL